MTTLNGNGATLTAVRPDIFQIYLEDEDGQNILSIDDGALRQSLRIEIVNTSGKSIEFQSVDNKPTLKRYHFCISFRPGTLLLAQDGDKRISLKETGEGWQMQQEHNTFYLLNDHPRVIEHGERITLTLENIGAAPEGGSRGTRVEIKYNNLQYQGSSETISGNRLQYLNIVNQRGKKQIPLYVGFLGSNTILNDGTENELILTIQSLPNQSVSLTVLESPEIIEKETRWQGNLLQFIKEKISNFNEVITEIQEDQEISDASKQFFNLFKQSLDAGESLEDFIEERLAGLILNQTDRQTILRILFNKLGVIIQDDLNAILTQLEGILYPSIQEAITLIKATIQESDLKVIKSTFNPNGSLELKGLDSESLPDEAAKFTIFVDVTDTNSSSKNWALVNTTDADEIQIDIVGGGENWTFGGKEQQGITPRWSFICKERLQLTERQEILRLNISSIKTQLLSGYANLYVHYENIPGYWDGYITVPIHKGPLVYRETTANDINMGCVGIGTDKPQAKLHVKSSSGVDGLKVEGNTTIQGNLTLTDNGNITSNNQNHQILFRQNENQLELRECGDIVFSPGCMNGQETGKVVMKGNGNVGVGIAIGTDEPQAKLHVKSSSGVDGLKVEGNTAIQGKLTLGADIYFTKTDHTYTGIGNTEGYAAIENAKDYGALMILGRSGPNGRCVKLWDELQVKGKMTVTGDLILDTKPIIFKRYDNLGNKVMYNTNYSTNDYSAAIVGFRALDGDIEETGANDIIKVYMYMENNTWWIGADFFSGGKKHETWVVDVMFVSNNLARIIDY
jgi:hypothetical protein